MQLTDQLLWEQKEIGLEDFDVDKIYDVETNITIGCWYVSKLMKQFDNDLLLVLAAYNAGSGNVTKWLQNEKYSKSGKD